MDWFIILGVFTAGFTLGAWLGYWIGTHREEWKNYGSSFRSCSRAYTTAWETLANFFSSIFFWIHSSRWSFKETEVFFLTMRITIPNYGGKYFMSCYLKIPKSKAWLKWWSVSFGMSAWTREPRNVMAAWRWLKGGCWRGEDGNSWSTTPTSDTPKRRWITVSVHFMFYNQLCVAT